MNGGTWRSPRGDVRHAGGVYLMLISGRQVNRQTSFLSLMLPPVTLRFGCSHVHMCACDLSTCSALLFSSFTVPFASNIYYIPSVLTSLRISLFVLSLKGAVNDIICLSLCVNVWGRSKECGSSDRKTASG